MNFHLLAFSGNVANGATFAKVPTILDTYFTQVTDGMVSRLPTKVIGAYARGADVTDVRINSPDLRLPAYPRLGDFDLAAAPPNLPPFNDYGDNGPTILPSNPINVEISRAGGAPALCQSLLFVAASMPTRTYGQVRTLKWTTACAIGTTAWVPGAVTNVDSLPYGQYRIVGMRSFGTNLLAARIVFPDAQHRPGCIAQQALGEYSWDYFNNGNLGVWGTFWQNSYPSIECIGIGAGAAQEHYVDIIAL